MVVAAIRIAATYRHHASLPNIAGMYRNIVDFFHQEDLFFQDCIFKSLLPSFTPQHNPYR